MNRAIIFFLIILIVEFTELMAQNFKDCHCIKYELIDSIYEPFLVEKRPMFPGGDEALLKYVAEHMPNQQPDSDEVWVSSFYVRFVIDTTGQLKNLCMMRPIYPDRLSGFEHSLLLTISEMPIWIPAQNKGKRVPVRFIIPIRINWQ